MNINQRKITMNDIIGARYWYKPTKQYGYELVSFRIDKFWNEESKKPVYKPYVDVFLKKSKIQKKKNYTSVEGYLDEEFFMERWTGVEDYNGQKIYEGDIVEVVYDTPYQTDKRNVGVIRYGKPHPEANWLDEFYLEEQSNNTSFYLFDYYIDSMNLGVIGNVNENPEMYEKLTQGKL